MLPRELCQCTRIQFGQVSGLRFKPCQVLGTHQHRRASIIDGGAWCLKWLLVLLLIVQCRVASRVGPLLSIASVRNHLMQVSQLACCVLQEALNVKPNTTFVGCSDKVASVLGPDVMKSVKPLIPDLLAALPVLLYQGQSVSL